MKAVRAEEVALGEVFLFQAPDQPLRAWLLIGKDGLYCEAESMYSYAEFAQWTPRERTGLVSAKPANHHPVKYLKLRSTELVLA